jgi:hypothetical protein
MFLVLVLAVVAGGVFALKDLNAGLLRNGCIGDVGLPPSTGRVQFKAFPPHFFCRYRTKDGRVVERSS